MNTFDTVNINSTMIIGEESHYYPYTFKGTTTLIGNNPLLFKVRLNIKNEKRKALYRRLNKIFNN